MRSCRYSDEWERIGVSAEAGVTWLNSLARTAERAPAPDFVWTGPEVVGLHARDTRRVYEELIGSAQHSIWVCSYAFFDGPTAFATLAGRLDANPRLKVTLLLNIERRRGDTTVADSLVRRFADHFWERSVARQRPVRACTTTPVRSLTTDPAASSTPRRWWQTTRQCSSRPRT